MGHTSTNRRSSSSGHAPSSSTSLRVILSYVGTLVLGAYMANIYHGSSRCVTADEVVKIITAATNNNRPVVGGGMQSSSLSLSTMDAIPMMETKEAFKAASPAVPLYRQQQQQQQQHKNSVPVVLEGSICKKSAHVAWTEILKLPKPSGSIVMEVGMHDAKQTLQAASFGMVVHGVEPSPTSFRRLKREVGTTANVYLHNAAAGPKSGDILQFTDSGGTGDHVGKFDMWEMKVVEKEENHSNPKASTINVTTLALDDLIAREMASQPIYILKVDTQGFESSVFAGLEKTLPKRQIKYIITEYWPKGMDLMAGGGEQCRGPVELLQKLLDAGYTLYALSVEHHPLAGKAYETMLDVRPFDDLHAHCMWLYNLDSLSSDIYKGKMGYWTDILAVAPGEKVPETLFPTKMRNK